MLCTAPKYLTTFALHCYLGWAAIVVKEKLTAHNFVSLKWRFHFSSMFLTSRIFRRFKLFNLPRVVVRHNCILAREPSISNARRHAELLLCPCHSRNLVNKSLSEPCWKCGSTEKGTYFFCEHCKALQKPDDNANYFHLLGAHESFDINLSDLSKKYRQLQSVLHPDKFSNATDVSEEPTNYIE